MQDVEFVFSERLERSGRWTYYPQGIITIGRARGNTEENFDFVVDSISHEFMHHVLYNLEGIIACGAIDRFYRGKNYEQLGKDETGLWIRNFNPELK